MNTPLLLEIPTVNKTGYASQTLDEYGHLFLHCVRQLSSPVVLDIGAGYGLTTLPALSAGAFVVANDLEQAHLDILKSKVPSHLMNHLSLCVGKFPQQLEFDHNNFDAIILSHVFHFLKAEEVEQGLPLVYKWLRPKGKIFLTAITPYVGVLKNFLPVYEKRKAEKQLWPGQIENIKEYCNHPCTELNPDFIHVFEPDILERLFLQAGFHIEKVGFYTIPFGPSADFKSDGRECVGIIASKPAAL